MPPSMFLFSIPTIRRPTVQLADRHQKTIDVDGMQEHVIMIRQDVHAKMFLRVNTHVSSIHLECGHSLWIHPITGRCS